jgi:hypothetical protein
MVKGLKSSSNTAGAFYSIQQSTLDSETKLETKCAMKQVAMNRWSLDAWMKTERPTPLDVDV